MAKQDIILALAVINGVFLFIGAGMFFGYRYIDRMLATPSTASNVFEEGNRVSDGGGMMAAHRASDHENLSDHRLAKEIMDFSASVKFMRVACPLAFLATILLGSLAWSQGQYGYVAINGFLAGVNAMLTWIQWSWFKI